MPRMMMLTPFLPADPRVQYSADQYGGPEVEVVGVTPACEFPTSIADLELAVTGMVNGAVAAERAGCDAVILGCFGDPGLEACRARVALPVIGVCQAALAVANVLATKFSVITIGAEFGAATEQQVRANGLRDRLASVRTYTCNIGELSQESVARLVCGLEPTDTSERDLAVHAAIRDTIAAVREDGAGAVIFGCLGMSWMIDRARAALREQGLSVPIIEPGATAIELTRAIISTGLRHAGTRPAA